MKILIDNGHGQNTAGKRSPDGRFREYEFNREISSRVVESLFLRGYDIEYLVPEIEDISLKERVRRVNAECKMYGSGNVIVVSIHSNACGNGKDWMNAKGWSCYTSFGNTKSDKLAEELYKAFALKFPDRKMRKDLTDGDSDIEADFYILKKTLCPAVLIENFFYDNKEECEWLLDPATKDRIADATILGIITYLDKYDL